ncbi:hypothetical protein ACWGNM_15545 [Streptomyces sp. NPDC055796]
MTALACAMLLALTTRAVAASVRNGIDFRAALQPMDGFGFSMAFQRADLLHGARGLSPAKQREVLDLLLLQGQGCGPFDPAPGHRVVDRQGLRPYADDPAGRSRRTGRYAGLRLGRLGPHRKAAALTGDHSAAARRRRDLALEGFPALREGGLREFHLATHCLKSELLDAWWIRWRDGPLAAAVATGRQLERLKAGDLSHLDHGEVPRLERPERQRSGMCGRLHAYAVPDPPSRPFRGPSGSPHPHPPKELF